jgi:cupin 2 domain-containing protein
MNDELKATVGNIPTRCKHRVEWTDPDVVTIWLAVHY